MKYRDLLEKIQNALLTEEAPPSSQDRAYASVPRVPQNLPPQPAPIKKALRKTDIVTKDWNKEVKHTSACSSNIEPFPEANLVPKRVNRWNLKNYSSLARRLQKLAKYKTEDMSGKVSVISQEENNRKEEKKQDELWRDMMKVNEERQFRIGRITDFFS